MRTILTLAILFVAVFAVLFFVSGAKSVTTFLSDIRYFVRNLLTPRRKQHDPEEGETRSRENDCFRSRHSKDGRSGVDTFAADGVKVELTVLDRANKCIRSETLRVSRVPILIGRGGDDANGKISLPDVYANPETSREHCELVLVNGVPTLRDCHTKEESVCNGRPVHSMSFVGDQYVGDGLTLGYREVRVEIGDFTLLLKRISEKGVPTFGAASAGKSVPTFSAAEKGGAKACRESPTKPFKFTPTPTKKYIMKKRG